MPKMREALCKPQPVAFLLPLHIAGASLRQESMRDRTVPGLRKAGETLRTCARGARKNANRVSGANEFRSGEPEARSNCRPCRAGPASGKSAFHEDRIYLASQSRPFVLFPFAQGT